MKLYSTLERHWTLPAVCPPLAESALRISPPSVSVVSQESVLAAVPASVEAAGLVARLGSALVPVAVVAASATGSVPGGTAARADESTIDGPAATRPTTDDLPGVDTRNDDQLHVASAAQLDQRGIRVQGTSGFNAKHEMTALKPNGGVRGAPPRGRPV